MVLMEHKILSYLFIIIIMLKKFMSMFGSVFTRNIFNRNVFLKNILEESSIKCFSKKTPQVIF